MNIASHTFFLLFLPLSPILYWLVLRKPRHKLIALFLLSTFYYLLAGGKFVILLLALSLITYWLAKKRSFTVGVVINLFGLLVFKLWGFGIENLQHIAAGLGYTEIHLLNLIMPLGISFYVFKHVGYLLDVRQNRYPASNDLLVFITHSAYFPQISAGPISNYQEMADQFQTLPEKLDLRQAFRGVFFMSVGLAKKLLIADVLSYALDASLFGQGMTNSGALWAWLSVLIFSFQIYFDFSGYTDLVLGVSYLFGVTLPDNFNNPYQSINITQFWQRWHISLSSWFRIYLYSPLSRSLLRRFNSKWKELAQWFANIITMSLIGLWHGTTWPYILWGAYHGLLLGLRSWAERNGVKVKCNFLGWALTQIGIVVGWGLFLSPNLGFADHLFTNLFGFYGVGNIGLTLTMYDKFTITTLVIAMIFTGIGFVEAKNFPEIKKPCYMLLWGIIFFLCLMLLGGKTEFIYMLF